jgi:hypothetical protein
LPTTGEYVQSVLVIIVVLALSAFLWLIGSKELSSGLIGLLAGELIHQFLFSRKDVESGLAFRAANLAKPLQDIFSDLSGHWELHVGEVVSTFEKEIQDRAMVKVLQKDSEKLPRLFSELKELEREISKKEYEERMKTMFPRHQEIIDAVKATLYGHEPRAAELREQIRDEIEHVLAKYSGA